ncbi:MAG: response regulator [Lachnospiraceae bacterium]|nr:response regulator [Lachnospiraceae bacterium]
MIMLSVLAEQNTFWPGMILILLAMTGSIIWLAVKITVMRRRYEELKRLKDESQLAIKARTMFLANMSQELLSPINTIVGMNEMSLRESTSENPEEYSENIRNYAYDIRNASESLKYLVSDLLELSAVESGEIHLYVREYDIVSELGEVIALIRSRCDEKGIDFTVKAEEMLPRRLSGDIGKIKHILLNLLTNSVRYTDTGGIVLDVSLSEKTGDDGILRISVKDTGMGMDETIVRNLFTVYDKIGEEGHVGAINTGVALGISHRLAEFMGGELTCSSEPGKGTEFVLTLKQKIADKTPVGVFAEQTERSLSNYVPLFKAPDADILVVSSDPMTVKVIKGLLKKTEVFVTVATNAKECTDKIRGTKYHIILFDHMLNDEDGGLLEELWEKNRDVPVYAITSKGFADEAFYRSKGYNGCIFKPVSGLELERIIMKHLPENMMDILEDITTRR